MKILRVEKIVENGNRLVVTYEHNGQEQVHSFEDIKYWLHKVDGVERFKIRLKEELNHKQNAEDIVGKELFREEIIQVGSKKIKKIEAYLPKIENLKMKKFEGDIIE